MMALRNLALGAGILLAACGSQPPSASAANDATAVLPAEPAAPATPEGPATPAAAPVATDNQQQDYTLDRTNQTGAKVIGDILVKVGTLDGARITGFKLSDRCHTAITTASGTATIDWSKVDDWAARIEGSQRIIPIDDGSGSAHLIGVPEKPQPEPVGNAGALVESGFGSLADNCK